MQGYVRETIHISSRTCDPDRANFEETFLGEVASLAKTCQIHGPCRTSCWKYGADCRYGFPKELVDTTNADKGYVQMQRDHQWVNSYNPFVLAATRSNGDCQFLTSGKAGVASIYYIAYYMAKNQQIVRLSLLVANKLMFAFVAEPRSQPAAR